LRPATRTSRSSAPIRWRRACACARAASA
jgi:hypothetical protein